METNPQPFRPASRSKGIPLVLLVSVAIILAFNAAFSVWNYLKQTQDNIKQLVAIRPEPGIIANTNLPNELQSSLDFPLQTTPNEYPDKEELLERQEEKVQPQSSKVIANNNFFKPELVGKSSGTSPKTPSLCSDNKRKVDIILGDYRTEYYY